VKTVPIFSLLLAALCLISPAYAAIPALPEIPTTLPDAVREPLIAKRKPLALKKQALISEGEANTRQCTNIKEGSEQHQACLSKLREFNAKVEALRVERDRLADEIEAAIAANTDPIVVDARVALKEGADLLAQVPELERSPAADRIRKGFQALMTVPRDWPVALAWWQEALQRDPNNAALIRSVDLAQWMVDSRKRAASRQTTSTYPVIDAFMRGDATDAIQLIEQAKKRNVIQDAEAERMTNIINKQVKQRAAAPTGPKLSPKSASMAQMATAGDRALSEQMFEEGLQFLIMGDYQHADQMFGQADFQRNFDAGKP